MKEYKKAPSLEVVTIRLRPELVAALKKRAKQCKMGFTTLIRAVIEDAENEGVFKI